MIAANEFGLDRCTDSAATQELKNSRTQELKKPKKGAMRNSARDPVPSPLICEICEICGSKFGI
jgi:hypothetical protein